MGQSYQDLIFWYPYFQESLWDFHDEKIVLDGYGLLTKYREVNEEEEEAFNFISGK